LTDWTQLPENPYYVGAQFDRWRLLYHYTNVFKLRYKDILAAADTGDGALLGHICNFLGISVPADAVKFAQGIVGSSTATKNKGVADRWKTELSPTILKNFMDRYGSLVAEFGYPVD